MDTHIRSCVLLSASENSIESIPSPVYQCKYARRLYIAANCVSVRLNSSCTAVVFAKHVAACV